MLVWYEDTEDDVHDQRGGKRKREVIYLNVDFAEGDLVVKHAIPQGE